MTNTTDITGLESTRELLRLRRLDKSNRIHRRVERLLGDAIRADSERDAYNDSITRSAISHHVA